MLLVAIFALASVCSSFFYCQAIRSGLGRKRWATAGFCFGPIVWPMFCMQRRMKVNKKFGFNYLIVKV